MQTQPAPHVPVAPSAHHAVAPSAHHASTPSANHIVIVNNIYPPIMAGGAELIVAYLSEGLAARGHRVTVVSTCGPEMEPYPVETRNGVEVIRFFPRNLYWSFTRSPQPGVRKALWHLRDAWNRDAARRFGAVLAERRPDIVHTHLIDGLSASIWRRARRAGIPVVHTAHDYHLLCPRAFLLTRDWKLCTQPSATCRAYRTWHLRTARDVDLFVSPSRFLLEHHMQSGLRPAGAAVIRNGIPLPESAARIRAARQQGGLPRFLLLCRLTVEKGVRVVLEAMRRLPPGLDLELVIAGRGPLEEEVRAAAEADPRIRFLGYVQGAQKEEILSSCHHLLIPSLWYENAPVAVVEAAAYGLGLLGSRIGGIPELVEEGRTGLLFPPGDAAALAQAMEGLASGSVRLQDFDTAAAAVAARHGVDEMVEAYLHRYRLLLGTAPAPLAGFAGADNPADAVA